MSSPSPSSFPTLPEGTSEPQFDLLTWLEVNKQLLVGAAAAIVVAVIATMFVRYQHEQTEVAADRALLAVTSSGTPEAAVSSAKFLEVAAAHSGTRAAERARMLAAGRLFTEGKPADARAQFEKFAADFPDSPLAGTAALGIASALDAENKATDAIAAYQRVIGTYGTESIASQARLSKARLHEAANQPELALALYDDITKSATATTSSSALQPAMAARAALLQKHPELDKPSTLTNSVKITPAPTK